MAARVWIECSLCIGGRGADHPGAVHRLVPDVVAPVAPVAQAAVSVREGERVEAAAALELVDRLQPLGDDVEEVGSRLPVLGSPTKRCPRMSLTAAVIRSRSRGPCRSRHQKSRIAMMSLGRSPIAISQGMSRRRRSSSGFPRMPLPTSAILRGRKISLSSTRRCPGRSPSGAAPRCALTVGRQQRG